MLPYRRIAAVALSLLFSAFAAGSAAAAGDADAGKSVFRKCMACHRIEPGRNAVGPSLYGVFGRAAATDEKYRYSSALREAGLTWDEATLDRWLTKPRDLVPGTKMGFPGLKDAEDRQNVIAYLKTLGAN
ncbi:MAG: cytochrome c family protein [Rhodospirillales bacterium]|nr:cytochrome c family protein [Rhodospirillales bacterium]